MTEPTEAQTTKELSVAAAQQFVPAVLHDRGNIALLPTQEEVNVLSTIAQTAADSKHYANMGGMAGLMSVMLYAREVGVPPMTAISGGFHIIQGKVEMAPQLMLMKIRQMGHTVRILEDSASKAVVQGIRCDNGEEHTITYTIEDAKRAGLIKPQGAWEKVPDDMCFWRAIGKLGRRHFTDVIHLAYTEGEIAIDFETNAPRRTRRKKQAILVPSNPTVQTSEGEPAETAASTGQEESGTTTNPPNEEKSGDDSATPEPSPEIEAYVADIMDYLRDQHNVKIEGITAAKKMICDEFAVSAVGLIPEGKLADVKKFCRITMMKALEEKGFIPSAKRG